MGCIAVRTAIAGCVLLAGGAAAEAGGVAGPAHAAASAISVKPTGDVAAWQPPFAAPGLDETGLPAQPDNGEVSCAGTSYCAMVGIFVTGRTDSNITAYVLNKIKGSWDTASQIPGLAALNTGGQAAANAVSCATPGNCAAGGSYSPKYGSVAREPFAVSEANGVWQAAQAVAGLPDLGANGSAEIDQVSCATPGDCAATGAYHGGNRGGAFVVEEASGRWGSARTLPSVSALGGESIESLSCPSPGNCAAVGGDPGSDNTPAFVIDEAGGRWGTAMRIAGMPATEAGLASVSCPSAGNCVAVGTYTAVNYPDGTAMEVTQTNGHWGSSRVLPGVSASSVSCPADGYCTVLTSGDYAAQTPRTVIPATGNIVEEVNGGWLRPLGTPGYTPDSVSCTAPGYCSATGYWALGDVNTPDESAIGLIDEAAGTWGPWNLLPDTITYPYEAGAVIDPLSCGAPGNCALHGYYEDQYGPPSHEWAAAKALVPATATALSPPAAPPVYGREQAGRFSVTVVASSGTPPGRVDIMSGQRALCSVQLIAGSGGCTMGAARLPGGTYRAAAYYGVTAGFASSYSAQAALVIARAATVARLALTRRWVRYGAERSELLKVSVTPRYAGVPDGSVTVMTGRTSLCTIRLSARKGACPLGARALKPGRYRLTARYQGSDDFSPSRSAPSWLVVLRGQG